MGKRREPRKEIKVPVRIFGTDSAGQIFSEKVSTVNISRSGAEVEGVKAQLNAEEIIGLTYGQTKAHFRIKWIGPAGTPVAGHLGLLNLTPEKALWDFPLPAGVNPDEWRSSRDRRAHPRYKYGASVELHPGGDVVPIRARTMDLSLGGCFVEMSNPLKQGTQTRIALWAGDTKLWADARVITSTPGFGIGVQFTKISPEDEKRLKEFLEEIRRRM
jgi:hypothetical protein